jgi:hypothetical protein
VAGPAGAQGASGLATGPAGGALSGSYPDPSIANGAVGTAQQAQVPLGTLLLSAPQAVDAPVNTQTEVNTGTSGGLQLIAKSGNWIQIQVTGCYEIEGHLFWSASNSQDRVNFRLLASATGTFSNQAEESIDNGAPGEGGVSMSAVACLPAGGYVQLDYIKRYASGTNMTLVGGNIQAHWVSR